jgi:hypothetical protein
MIPVAIIAALVIMIAALIYTAFNRSHEVAPAPPCTVLVNAQLWADFGTFVAENA